MSATAIKKAIDIIAKALRLIVKIAKEGHNDDESRNSLPLISTIGIIMFILLIPILAISQPGLIVKSQHTSTEAEKNNYNFYASKEDTEIYKKCDSIYNEIKKEYNKKVADKAKELKYRNPIDYEYINVNGEEILIPVYPEVQIIIDIDEFDVDYLLAYVNTEYFEEIENENFNIPEREIENIIKSNTSLEYSYYGENPIYLYAIIRVDKEAIENLFKDQYTQDGISKEEIFKVSYESLKY